MRSLIVSLSVLLPAAPALALQPLEVFVSAAREHSVDSESARANLEAERAQADVALGHALPGLALRGTYTRNQYEISFMSATGTTTITPKDQLDASAVLTVPLIDLASFRRVSAARTGVEAAQRGLESTQLQVEAAAVQDYYQLVADLALLAASQQALAVSREGLRLAEARLRAGSSPALDVDRARAEVEQRVQQVAGAELQVALAAQALQSLSAIAPDVGAGIELSDDLHPEPPLASFQGELARTPAVEAAALGTRAAEKQVQAQRLALVPTLSGSLIERGTNATGFTGKNWSYQAILALSWAIDFTSFASIRAQEAQLAAARAGEERVRLLTRDAIHRQWNVVAAAITRSQSARVGQQAAEHAAQLAQDRYQAGTTTQLELLQAQRDAFAAQVTRIQADADLVNARAQLRLAVGQSVVAPAR